MSDKSIKNWSMADVSAKAATHRVAVASGSIRVGEEAFDLIMQGKMPKGDPLAMAEIAGIQAAKQTPSLIPLCHPLAIHGVDVLMEITDKGVAMLVTVMTVDRTGVEMEALTAASVGALALIDMVKGRDRMARIECVELREKKGGRSGHWTREAHA